MLTIPVRKLRTKIHNRHYFSNLLTVPVSRRARQLFYTLCTASSSVVTVVLSGVQSSVLSKQSGGCYPEDLGKWLWNSLFCMLIAGTMATFCRSVYQGDTQVGIIYASKVWGDDTALWLVLAELGYIRPLQFMCKDGFNWMEGEKKRLKIAWM